jgi:hypothetical protein
MEETTPHDKLHAIFVVGTRPEAIKMLPLIVAVRDSTRFQPIVVSTGQHAELVAHVLAIGGITPDVTFDLPPAPRTLNTLFSAVLVRLEAFLHDRFGPPLPPAEAPYATGYPAAAFVHGDTTSAAASALASIHLHLPVVHVEAGLRTNDTLSPFPEELNRQLISRIAAWHLAPTERNKENLIREHIAGSRIFVTGNTAIDALQLLTGVALVVSIVYAFLSGVPYRPSHLWILIFFLTLSFGPGVVTLALRGGRWYSPFVALVLVIPYTAYSWIVFPVLAVGLFRQLSGRTSWAKTARETQGLDALASADSLAQTADGVVGDTGGDRGADRGQRVTPP